MGEMELGRSSRQIPYDGGLIITLASTSGRFGGRFDSCPTSHECIQTMEKLHNLCAGATSSHPRDQSHSTPQSPLPMRHSPMPPRKRIILRHNPQRIALIIIPKQLAYTNLLAPFTNIK
jgi:hypothetical protein